MKISDYIVRSRTILPPHAGFGRVIFFIVTFFEVIAAARRDAATAYKRYPFAEW
jgi:hypothetical protein